MLNITALATVTINLNKDVLEYCTAFSYQLKIDKTSLYNLWSAISNELRNTKTTNVPLNFHGITHRIKLEGYFVRKSKVERFVGIYLGWL